MKVLIIDDEALVRRSLRRAMEPRKFEVQEAENGEVGETIWLEMQPDLVILDVLMPGMSGPQLIEKVRGKHNSKIALISAYTGEYNIASAKKIGAEIFIPKPFEDIYEVIETVIGLV